MYYYLFDVLSAGCRDTRELPLTERKTVLAGVVDFRDPLRFTEHRQGNGEAFREQACRDGSSHHNSVYLREGSSTTGIGSFRPGEHGKSAGMSARHANLVTSGGVTIQLSHLEKVFFPDENLRKGDLVDYYRMVAPRHKSPGLIFGYLRRCS